MYLKGLENSILCECKCKWQIQASVVSKCTEVLWNDQPYHCWAEIQHFDSLHLHHRRWMGNDLSHSQSVSQYEASSSLVAHCNGMIASSWLTRTPVQMNCASLCCLMWLYQDRSGHCTILITSSSLSPNRGPHLSS